jgi:hypothetical protein
VTDCWQREMPVFASGDDVAVTARPNARYPHLYVVMRVDDHQVRYLVQLTQLNRLGERDTLGRKTLPADAKRRRTMAG